MARKLIGTRAFITIAILVIIVTIVKCTRELSSSIQPSRNRSATQPPTTQATEAASFSYFGLPGMVNASYAKREHRLFDKTIATSDLANKDRIVERCESQGLYLGSADLGVHDCSKACNSSNYDYAYVPYQAVYTMNFFALEKPGAYCLPTEMAKCNLRTGSIVRTSTGGWACRAMWPRIAGGQNANEIRVCNGQLVDRISSIAAPRLYVDLIPRDILPITSEHGPEEERLSTGEYRFACADEHPGLAPAIVDDMHNSYIASSELPRLTRIRNVCNDLVYNGPTDNRPNFTTGNCDCTVNPSVVPFGRIRLGDVDMDKTNIECSPCIFGPIKKENSDHGMFNVPRRCLKTFHYSARLTRTANRNSSPTAEDVVLFVDVLPCGRSSFSQRGKACLNSTLYASKFDYPSHFAYNVMRM